MSKRQYTTREAAAAVGISRQTLQAWIAGGKIVPPKPKTLAGFTARLWSESDVARLRRIKERIYKTGRTGRPRKKK